MSLLQAKNLSRSFGGLLAVSDVSFQINEHELVGLIGPNGAGKTTLFNVLTGIYEPSEGTVELSIQGTMRNIGGMKPYKVTSLGLARTFQNIRLFQNMSVLDNVKLAMHTHIRYGTLSAVLRLPSYYKEEARANAKARDLLAQMGLIAKEKELAKNLPYGEQRKLEIARALASEPVLLFLDEPAAGMNPQETAELTGLIREIKDRYQLSIVLIEHDMSLVMSICERIFVLDYGKLIASGTPLEIKHNKRVIEAYLGEEV